LKFASLPFFRSYYFSIVIPDRVYCQAQGY